MLIHVNKLELKKILKMIKLKFFSVVNFMIYLIAYNIINNSNNLFFNILNISFIFTIEIN